MNFKKLISVFAAAALAACLAVPAFAEEEEAAAEEDVTVAEEADEKSDSDLEDIEMPVARAILTNGMWGQSITYSNSELAADRFTEDTQIIIEFETEGNAPNGNAPVELILQNYDVEPQIWAKVSPAEYDETSAVFNYADMVIFYGSDDLSGVNNICIGDCGEKMKLTKFTATNVKPKPVVTTAETTTAAETEAVTEAPVTEAVTEVTTTAAPAAPVEEGGINMTVVVVIIVGVVVVAAAVVTIIVVKKSRKRFY
ncbi:MAG: hypothetical protein ACI4JF_08955 [Oscillospiraceae bacterium]